MNIEIIAVGTELLLGDILNTNAQFLSKNLADLGMNIYFQTVVGDNEERLLEALSTAYKRVDTVILTGGLGPTPDDLTKEVVCKFFNREMIEDKLSMDKIIDYFKNTNFKMSENNRKQALIPEGSIILKNDNGTAPGCIIEDSNKIAILLPGPPKEMEPMFINYVIPYMKKFQKEIIKSKVLKIIGMPESTVAYKIKDMIENQTNPTIATYAKEGEVTIRITAKSETCRKCDLSIEKIELEIKSKINDYIYGYDDNTLENVVGKMLIESNTTISTAESCTGGLIAAKLIECPGISNVFVEGDITYSNNAKIRRLGVKENTLETYGAVSSQVAIEMAEGIAKETQTDIGISTTGIAGPDGGSLEKPLGLVYIGLYYKGKVDFKELHLKGNREKIRNKATNEALNIIRLMLLTNKVKLK